ncbi:phosphatidate phosphatase LPIN1 isoform X2 [Teleopsis dalmanni]|uniref:phosphatidate phosphatase LPIN1 isoform X2 n=1 Tax=Teleopsis dalmanni TaxID=139649 RepID=UPI0018CFA11D|nr:phosphatidate phosphatase LPIN1 isoform X2 [Teleopsis dalmanni]
MNSLVKVFSNFREFYSEINGATLTGAIDVICVEQPDGEFQCSPFHVRFGKLGVLRSREKVVDIEINGEPVDIHMKLGETGEAFFVEECPEDDVEELPDNLATSPIPTSYMPNKFDHEIEIDPNDRIKNASDDIQLPLPLPIPRRNSIDLTKDVAQDQDAPKFENQVSDFSHRRHTDNALERRNLSFQLKEYTTQKLRQEWAEHEEIFQFDTVDKEKDWINSTQSEQKPQETTTQNLLLDRDVVLTENTKDTNIEKNTQDISTINNTSVNNIIVSGNTGEQPSNNNSIKEESKSKKKRRKKSQMKKKNAQRKSSSSSSIGSNTPQDGVSVNVQSVDESETMSLSISNNTNSSNDESTTKSGDQPSAPLITATTGEDSILADTYQTTPITTNTRMIDLDIHFFSDTEVTSPSGNGVGGASRGAGRPSTPIQSDSELEITLSHEKAEEQLVSNTPSWKWGELPTPEKSNTKEGNGDSVAQHKSMLSSMFNFMKKHNKMRKQGTDGGVYLSDLDTDTMDPEMVAMYFPNATITKEVAPTTLPVPLAEDDRESGNGTSLPHSPSSMEGQKSVDSDYDDGKLQENKYLDFVAMSLCGFSEKGNPTDEEFDRHMVKYSDVCENPSLFSSPNLIVRLNGKYFSWAAACPIVMTIITFQKPLAEDVVEQLMTNAKQDAEAAVAACADNNKGDETIAIDAVGQSKRSWWYWRRPQTGAQANTIIKSADKIDEKDADQTAVGTQTTRPNSPDVSDNTLSKTDSTLNAENTSALVENFEELSQISAKSESSQNIKNERYKKSLRLSSDIIKKLNLKEGMNEVEFSVTTAYQGTTRCKCYLFRWKYNDKVVISDIDGTITKSDVLGHILPMVGKDWAQMGVAQLFSKIEQNGYKLLYLSARAIGQSRATREYLRSIRQGDTKLPDGPLLLNPTSLISAFHREVIERKPEQFKIACLSDIRDLFPDKDPFYAGYGNRINDVWAYRAVGIPIMRIFTINAKGELKHELTQTFQSSGYINQSLEVDEYFPAINTADDDYEYKTDIFDDEEEEDELQFSESDNDESDGIDDGIDIEPNDEYVDDDIEMYENAKILLPTINLDVKKRKVDDFSHLKLNV